jgi:hypothetical protein
MPFFNLLTATFQLASAPFRRATLPTPSLASLDAAESAYKNLLHKVRAKIQTWQPQPLNLLGRAHLARQELASKLVYQANFSDPGERLRPVQLAISGFICTAGTPEEEQPFESNPFISQRVLSLQPSSGGVGAPNLQVAAASMRAKPIWWALCHSAHPAWQLLAHEISAALPAPPDAPPGLHCLVTRPALLPLFPPHATPSTKHAVEAFRQLRFERIATPEQQDFHSIMLELTFSAEGGRPQQGELRTAAARSWLRLSQVREVGLRQEQLSADEGADWEQIVAALPARWRAEVQRVLAPEPVWLASARQWGPGQRFSGGAIGAPRRRGRCAFGSSGTLASSSHSPSRWCLVPPPSNPRRCWCGGPSPRAPGPGQTTWQPQPSACSRQISGWG